MAFFVSGATGLLYEIVFSRLLALEIGSSTLALTIVLTIFMGGLGLGAFVAGRRTATMADPARAYAICELAIASALAVPLFLSASAPLLGWLYGIAPTPRAYALLAFPVCAIPLLVPTMLMGATLPLLVEAFSRQGSSLSLSTGTLYAVNTLGACAGALATGFVVLPALGNTRTLLLGVATNLVLGTVVWRSLPRLPATEAPATASPARSARGEARPAGHGNGERRYVAAAYAVSGFVAMALQVGWTRAAALSIGSSTYTFSLVVAAFIFGLAAGAALMGRLERLTGDGVAAFGALQVAIALSSAAVLPLFGTLPLRAHGLISANRDSFGRLMGVELVTLFALVSLPTLLMGALFPVAVRRLSDAGAGNAVGAAYGANTVGGIAGAFVAGFLLLPALGIRDTLLVASGIGLLSGCISLALPGPRRAPRIAAAVTIALLCPLAAMRLPAWDRTLLTSAPYLLDPGFQERLAPSGDDGSRARIVFFRDDPDVSVAVEKVGDGHLLRLNGKVDASTFGDMPTQQLLGHLPMLLHARARRACVIGMGSGVTAGAVASYPGLERVDVVEIAPSVIEAARYFADVNHRVHESPAARFLLADGRTHLRFTRERYDVIVSEPSNPWIAGIGKLFTVEFFQECRDRLAPGGVMAAWLQTYGSSREAVGVVLGSFLGVFPEATVWTCSPGDLILVGSNGPIGIDVDAVTALVGAPALASDMDALWIAEPADLLSHLRLGPEQARRLAAEAGRVNSDDDDWLEFEAPRTLHARSTALRASDVLGPGAATLPLAVSGSEPARMALESRLSGILAAAHSAAEAQEAHDARDLAVAEARCRDALARNPRDLPAALILGDVLFTRLNALVDTGRAAEALPLVKELERLRSRDPRLAYGALAVYLQLDRMGEALPWLDRLARADPADLSVRTMRAAALLETGRPADARAELETVLSRTPDEPAAVLLLGRALLAEGRAADALPLLDRAVAHDPRGVEPRRLRARAHGAAGDLEAALRDLEGLFDQEPQTRAEAWEMLTAEGDRLAARGEEAKAAAAYARALIVRPR